MAARAARLWVVACALGGVSCSSDGDSEKPPVGYDGPWAPLPEEGEWKTTEPYAPCSDIQPGDSAFCDTQSGPRAREGCDPASLEGLERRGAVYLANIRIEGSRTSTVHPEWNIYPEHGGFRFDASGALVSVMGNEQSLTQVHDQAFFVRGASVSFDGCKATSPRELTGCFVVCGRTGVERFGSFRARRTIRREGEAESSGGLQLRSESFVEVGKPADVYVAKDHAYVVSLSRPLRTGGLTVFDVRDKQHPVRTAAISLLGDNYWNDVEGKGDALYIASGDRGIIIYDISDPAAPAFVSTLGVGFGRLNVHTLFLDGDRLYAVSLSQNAALVYDVSKPLEPVQIHRYALGDSTQREVSLGRPRAQEPHDIFVYEGRLYINHLSDGLLVMNLEGPQEKALMGRYVYPYAFSHTSVVGTFNGRTIAFEGGEMPGSHLRVLDVTNPANIVKIGEYTLNDFTSIHNMVLVGTRLYIAWYHEGVRVLDVSDPAQPREVAHYNTYRETDPGREDRLFEGAIGVRVPGDGYVYVVETARGLLIYDELP